MSAPRGKKTDISIVVCGQAGQGIQTVEHLLTRVLRMAGFDVFATKEYMSRIRGGSNSTEIRVSSGKVSAPVNRIDILIPLDKKAIPHLGSRISKDTLILGEAGKIGTERDIVDVPFSELASAIGNPLYSNIISVGVILGMLDVEKSIPSDYISHLFSRKEKKTVQGNIAAIEKGYEVAGRLSEEGRVDKKSLSLPKGSRRAGNELLVNGAEAVAMGAIAGGCNFVSSYPMSPSTGVLVALSQQARNFGIVAEQAEDEISAVNMAIGAWYAGARALVTTSGGGFALMEEGVSLAGIIESPLVVHIAQRPGPATGLPTRTEQGDLELVLYSGHGDFPRILLAPGDINDAFYLTQKALNLADKYQVPVFILTDQYTMDSYYNVEPFDLSKAKAESYIEKTGADYKRYGLDRGPLSGRGVPGFGEGLVTVDSDEHDESGHITEDLGLRIKMVDKRLGKFKLMEKDIVEPELIGPRDYKVLVIGWGSTYNSVKEAVSRFEKQGVAFLHYKQVYPLHPDTAKYLKKAKKAIIVENNATAQFGKVIKLCAGVDIKDRILKYDGMQFFADELTDKLRAAI